MATITSSYASSPSAQALLKEIQAANKSPSFETLLKGWRENYGTPAVSPLLQLAKDRSIADPQRYVALMGAAKLGGAAVAPLLMPLLKDPSWMIRSGALRALAALHEAGGTRSSNTAQTLLSMLRDPALVVRMEAISTLEILKPEGTEDALVSTLTRSENYHHRIAQWVPQRALKALQALNAKKAIPRIKPLLEHSHDPELQKATLEALETLTGKKMHPKLKALPLPEQIREWKKLALQ